MGVFEVGPIVLDQVDINSIFLDPALPEIFYCKHDVWAFNDIMPIQHDHVGYIHNSSVYNITWFSLCIFSRGGVEDTRLEGQRHKKFRGQGHGQMHKCSQKKIFKKFFQAISKKKSSKFFFRRKRSKTFFQVISTWGKQKKVFANFLPNFWRFLSKFQQFKK